MMRYCDESGRVGEWLKGWRLAINGDEHEAEGHAGHEGHETHESRVRRSVSPLWHSPGSRGIIEGESRIKDY